jgi:hypothetical protein
MRRGTLIGMLDSPNVRHEMVGDARKVDAHPRILLPAGAKTKWVSSSSLLTH